MNAEEDSKTAGEPAKTAQQTAEPPKTAQQPPVIEGDVIGNTAYSQRFVLKLLLKIANLETLQEAITNDKSFEGNLCLLWDMSSDKDVVLYLQEHNTLKLVQFALPAITDTRIIEIMIGIVGNMCCHEEIVREIMKMDTLLTTILSIIQQLDTGILTEVFRLVEVCVYRSSRNDIDIWLSLFNLTDFADILYYTLKNSSNMEVLHRAFENLNTVCARCNDERYKTNFYLEFVKPTAISSILSAFTEVIVKQKDYYSEDFSERIMNITIQIILNLLSIPLNKSYQIFEKSKNDIVSMIVITLSNYKARYLEDKIVSADLSDISEAVVYISKAMHLYDVEYEKFVQPVYESWKMYNTIIRSEEDFKERDSWEMTLEEDKEFVESVNLYFSKTICYYLEKCSEDNLQKSIELLHQDLDDILISTKDENVKDIITKRTSSYLRSVKDNTDS